ncbi:MAG: translation initiation factor IF-3 [Phycisphaerae bacterium]|nr:translation initiation factor IF-3 [Phycisphaerae bacterium]
MKDRRKFSQDSKDLRRNHRIRISPIRLIDENEEQVGIVETKDAIARAIELGLDLVEVSPTARPPVCRIMDYGKYKYALAKKERKSKAHRHEIELKEVRIKTPKIGDHDLMIKVNHAREFLERGDRVQFSLRFRGRELAHIDEGRGVFEKIVEALSDVAKVDRSQRFEGRRLSMLLLPTGDSIRKKPSAPKSDAKETVPADPEEASDESEPDEEDSAE